MGVGAARFHHRAPNCDIARVSQVDEMSTQRCEITHHRQAGGQAGGGTIKDKCCPILNDKTAQLHYMTRSEAGRRGGGGAGPSSRWILSVVDKTVSAV